LSPAERELLEEVRRRRWVHRSSTYRGTMGTNGHHRHEPPADEGPPNGSVSDIPPWYRRRGLMIVLALIAVSWMGWPVVYHSQGRLAYEQGREDAAAALADERAALQDEQEEWLDHLEEVSDELYRQLNSYIASCELFLAHGELRNATRHLYILTLLEDLDTRGVLVLDHWRERIRRASRSIPKERSGE